MQGGAKLLFQSEQKRRKLRRLVKDISRFFNRPRSTMSDGGKAGPFLPHKGLTTLPNGEVVHDGIRSVNELGSHWDDGDFEVGPEPYLVGESSAMATDCNELLAAIDEGRWDDCDELTHSLYGQIDDITIGERATRRSYDTVFEEFGEALAFLQSAEYTAIWIPTTPELFTVEQFEHIDRRLAEQILKDPHSIFSVDPRFFEELVASIYADLGYRVILTKRTRDGGRDIICLAKKDGFDLKYIIECKRYAAHRKISVGQIRSLYGVKQDERVTKALLATTSTFTDSAKPHFWELQLIDHEAIMKMIKDYASGRNKTSRFSS